MPFRENQISQFQVQLFASNHRNAQKYRWYSIQIFGNKATQTNFATHFRTIFEIFLLIEFQVPRLACNYTNTKTHEYTNTLKLLKLLILPNSWLSGNVLASDNGSCWFTVRLCVLAGWLREIFAFWNPKNILQQLFIPTLFFACGYTTTFLVLFRMLAETCEERI